MYYTVVSNKQGKTKFQRKMQGKTKLSMHLLTNQPLVTVTAQLRRLNLSDFVNIS